MKSEKEREVETEKETETEREISREAVLVAPQRVDCQRTKV